jgi:hypothetical protein
MLQGDDEQWNSFRKCHIRSILTGYGQCKMKALNNFDKGGIKNSFFSRMITLNYFARPSDCVNNNVRQRVMN